jgi:hypothetical protein
MWCYLVALPAIRVEGLAPTRRHALTKVTYEVVEHDGGWAYKLGDVYSETFATHDEALAAARHVAMEQQQPGRTTAISWEDPSGRWHHEVARGDDRPETEVKD